MESGHRSGTLTMTTSSPPHHKLVTYLHTGLFLVAIIIVCIPVFSVDYLITLDGPNHLYTSRTFYQLIAGDDFYQTYFETNSNFTPNYLTVIVLGALQTIFSTIVSLKIFHLLHIFLLLFGAYFWSNSQNEKQRAYPFLILPFVYSHLFFSGFYNFILAVSISFFVLGLYDRFSTRKWKLKQYVIVGMLLFTVFASHIIPFFFTGLYIFIHELLQWKKSNWQKSNLLQSLYLLLAASPGLILTFLFTGERSSDISYLEFNELVSRISSGFSIVIRHETQEGLTTINWIKLSFLAFTLMLFLYGIFSKNQSKRLTLPITIFCILVLYFILPDSVGYASVFSVRIEYIFWLFIIIGCTRITIENKYLSFIPVTVGLALLIFQIKANLPYWRMLNGHAHSVINAAEHIEDNKVVYPVFNSLIWDDLHISNLAGTEKELMILENTSARQDYFPLIYNAPYEDCIRTTRSDQYNCNGQFIKVDYLLVIGKYILEDPLAIELYSKAYNEGEVVYEDDFVQLLKLP